MNARIAAPALPPSLDWVNTDTPPNLAALRGRVTLMHFWTFDCVNCRNVLPDLRYLENKYHDGLSVIGVHTPKFGYQRHAEPVLKAVNRNHIRHPVANDPEYLLWQAYGVESWPTLAVIDAQGQLAALLPGEGRRQEADTLIAHLLDEAAAQDLRVYESDIATVRPEVRAPLRFPSRLAVGESSLWISDSGHNRILECTHDGRILRQYGSGNPGYWDGRGRDAGFTDPQGLALGKDVLFVADTGNHALRRVRLLSGDVDTLAGTGTPGHDLPNENLEPAKVAMSAPSDVAVLGDNVYIAVSGQNQIWQLDMVRNKLVVLAGSGQLGLTDGVGVTASFAQPSSLSLIGQQLVIADAAASAIRLLRLLDNRVSTLVGTGLYDFGDAAGKREDARLQHPLAVCADARGLIFVADSYNGKIKAINMRSGDVRTLNLPYRLQEPAGLALAAGALWVANTNAHEILRVDLGNGQIRRLTISE
ncbi:MAG: redoxin family protein [Xanthomonadaceae bacterium]|nr:redoxin family protein [Xanthomonadaceae bacterium]MDE1886218.1 redoxin family protein [Xanthomonadaceae bacterium]MDE1962143.1 redoxin family protein [Xanthomonadaceae bacterium]MDE2083731.1 redoxin family protein [Xanthomonadaceae bacterium]MDE2256231.1 redoxin family protein [Xanthomonadaceae bacterium]